MIFKKKAIIFTAPDETLPHIADWHRDHHLPTTSVLSHVDRNINPTPAYPAAPALGCTHSGTIAADA